MTRFFKGTVCCLAVSFALGVGCSGTTEDSSIDNGGGESGADTGGDGGAAGEGDAIGGATEQGGRAGGSAGGSDSGGQAGGDTARGGAQQGGMAGGQGGTAGQPNTGGASSQGGSGSTSTPTGYCDPQSIPGSELDGTIDFPALRAANDPRVAGRIPPSYLAADPDAPRGTLMMGAQANARISRLYVPAQYDAAADGEVAFLFVIEEAAYEADRVVTVLDNLIHREEIPVTIAAWGIGQEFRMGAGNIPSHASRLENLIIDPLQTAYPKLADDPDMRVLVGQSTPGFVAFDLAWHRPDLARRVIADSGSFVCWGFLGSNGGHVRAVNTTSPAKPLRISLTAATPGDTEGVGTGCGVSYVQANHDLADALMARGYEHRYLIWPGQHTTQAIPTLAYNLHWLWRDRICD